MYGYELSTYISKELNISDGTVYPILRKLKSDGFVTTFLSEKSGGPPRKYYSITESGKEKCISESKEWLTFTEKISKLIKGVDNIEQSLIYKRIGQRTKKIKYHGFRRNIS